MNLYFWHDIWGKGLQQNNQMNHIKIFWHAGFAKSYHYYMHMMLQMNFSSNWNVIASSKFALKEYTVNQIVTT
eukprot:UN18597